MNFSALLSESCRQANLDYVKATDPWLLTELEIGARSWALDQLARHKAPPTYDMLKTHPEHRIMATLSMAGTDLRLLFGNVLDHLIDRRVMLELGALAERSTLEGTYPLDALSDLVRRAKGMHSVDRTSLLELDLDAAFDQTNLAGGLTFGFSGIDSAISCLLPAEFLVVAARTGIGKTIIVCNAAARWAQFGKRVLVVSCEMPPEQMLHRVFGQFGGFNPALFRQSVAASILAAQKPAVAKAIAEVRAIGGDIIFPRDRSLSMSAVESAILEEEPDVVIIDGIYLLRNTVASDAANWEKVKSSSNGLKQMALEYQVPIFGTTQFKRVDKVENFGVEDLAYSDAIGQDADMVIAAMHDDTVLTAHRLVLEIIKNRSGIAFARSEIDVDWSTMSVKDVPFTKTTLTLGVHP